MGSFCETVARSCFAPPSTLPEWRWYEENIELDNTSPLPSKYSCDLVPMVRTFTEYKQNPRVKRIVVMVSAQSAKTQTAINSLLHDIAEDPGPSMWVTAAADNGEEFAKKRLFPAVEDCLKTRHLLPNERKRRTKKLIQFDSMNLMMRGANSRIGLQSDPVRRIYCDERREWKKGAIELVRKRTRTFHNYLEVSMGTAGQEDDELHCDWKEGNQVFFHFTCPKCRHSQPFRFGRKETTLFPKPRERGGVMWDTNRKTRPGGKWVTDGGERRYVGGEWDYEEVKKTVRYECEQCGKRFRNAEKLKLLKTLHPVPYNPKAPVELVSMHWNALYMPWSSCDWAEIAVEFLKAWTRAKRGDIEPLVAFVTETLGEPFEEVTFFSPRREVKFESDYRLKGRDLSPGAFWDREHTRFMAVDKQIDHFWYVTRAFTQDGESRLVSCGRLETWEQVRDRQVALGVLDDHTVIDCGDDMPEVCEQCCIWGWRALRGDEARSFTHYESRRGQRVKVQRPWSVPQKYDPYVGRKTVPRKYRYAIWARWSNPSIKGTLQRLQDGKGVYWGIPADAPQVYLDQLNGERLKEFTDKWGHASRKWVEVGRKGCHMRDCECMTLTLAVIAGLLEGESGFREQAHDRGILENPGRTGYS